MRFSMTVIACLALCFVASGCKNQGSLSSDQISSVVSQHSAEMRQCYDKELQTQHDLAGKVEVKFTIASNGNVDDVTIADSTLKNANVENCLRTNIKSWRFPEPKGGGSVTVNYPFTFSAAN